MASEERKAADAKIAAENLFKTFGAGEQQAETDAFQCGRCKQVRLRLPLWLRQTVLTRLLAEVPLSPTTDTER